MISPADSILKDVKDIKSKLKNFEGKVKTLEGKVNDVENLANTLSLGEQIRFHRKNIKLTQKQLADRCGVKSLTISRWEREENHPPTKAIKKLCEILGCKFMF